ncbi:MAG: nucleotide exchange factor GrpE [Candidatus Aminicenantes bacterium]|nr:nucleotide exchange factor GrpE [Candidatus Aminicenantes bacterium]
MSGKKPEEEKKEQIENKELENKDLQEEKVKDSQEKKEIPFELSEQEEIEYLDLKAEDKPEVCEAKEKVEPSAEKEKEEMISKLSEELEAKEKEIAQLKSQVEELKDKFLRSLAELDNVRKRVEKEKEEYYQYALSDLLREILPIIDNFERALKTPEEETDGKTFKEGVELIYRMLLNLLRKYGVTPIELQDKKFDPTIHHALASEESDEVSEPEIKEELQKGYLIHNRLLRPTMVKVIIPKKN